MNIADKTIINILAKAIGAFMLLVSSVILARYLAKDELGTFLQAMLIVNTCTVLSFWGLPQSVYYFYNCASNRVRFVSQTLLMAIAFAVFWSAIIYRGADILASLFNNQDLRRYLAYVAIIMACRGISQFRDPVLISADKLVLNSLCSIVFELFFYLSTLLAPSFSFSLENIFRFMMIACLVEVACTIVVVIAVTIDEKKNRYKAVLWGKGTWTAYHLCSR